MKRNNGVFKTLVAAAVAVFMVACGNDSNQTEEVATETAEDVTMIYVEKVSDQGEKFSASLAIEGMSCEMMCGSKISSALADVEGVSNTELEFNGAEEDNFVIVEFDGNQISEQRMIDAVHALANGAYKVKSMEITHFIAPDGSTIDTETDKVEETEAVSMVKPKLEYQLPNVFSALARLF